MKNTPALWEISDGIVGLSRLKEVLVAADQTHLCCAFEMRRAVVSLRAVSSDKVENDVKCPSPTPTQQKITKRRSVTKDATRGAVVTVDPVINGFFVPGTTKLPDGFFGRKRRRRENQGLAGFDDGFVIHTTIKSNLTITKKNRKE